jgi:hypothetical protein
MKHAPRFAAAALTASLAAVGGGCTSRGVQVDDVTHSAVFRGDFRSPDLSAGSTVRCALLPALAPSQPGLAPLTGMSLLRALQRELPEHSIVPAAITASRINAAGLAECWHQAVSDYATGGVLDRDRMRKVADAAGARFLFMPVLGTLSTYSNNRFTFLGLVVNWTVSTTVDVSLQVWDSENGQLVWASTGSCTIEAEVVLNSRASVNRALETAFAGMIEDLVQGRSSSVRTRMVPASEVQAEAAEDLPADSAQSLPEVGRSSADVHPPNQAKGKNQ